MLVKTSEVAYLLPCLPPRSLVSCTCLCRNGPVFAIVGMSQQFVCGNASRPGVYARLSAYAPWMASVAGTRINTPAILWKVRCLDSSVDMDLCTFAHAQLPQFELCVHVVYMLFHVACALGACRVRSRPVKSSSPRTSPRT